MRQLQRNTSGQILILSALGIVIIIISSVTYVYQLTHYPSLKTSPVSGASFLANIEAETHYYLTQLLAQISHDETNNTLESLLTPWSNFVSNQYYHGYCTLQWVLTDTPPYTQGLNINWGEDGTGVSSTQITALLNLTGDVTINMNKQFTVITQLTINYVVTNITENEQQVTVTGNLQKASGPIRAKHLDIYYQNTTGWYDASQLPTYQLTSHYNGTYHAVFHLSTIDSVSMQCTDQRGIYVQANMTQ